MLNYNNNQYNGYGIYHQKYKWRCIHFYFKALIGLIFYSINNVLYSIIWKYFQWWNKIIFIVESCELLTNAIFPNITIIVYSESPLPNGRYPISTVANATCDEGYAHWPIGDEWEAYICNTQGSWSDYDRGSGRASTPFCIG